MGISSAMSFLGGLSLVPGPFQDGWICCGIGWVCRGWICPGGGYLTLPLDMGPGIPQDTVGKRAVRILLECFLVAIAFKIIASNAWWFRCLDIDEQPE